MTRRLVSLAVLAFAVTTLPAVVGAQPSATATPDSRWTPFLGCWRSVDDTAGTGARVCVTPASAGVELTTIVGGQVVSRESRVADGTARPVDSDGCTGTQTVRWSDRGTRIYRTASIACEGGAPRALATAAFFAEGPTWVDVETVNDAGTTHVRVSRLVRAANQRLADGTTLPRPTRVAPLVPAEAIAHWTVDDVIELAAALPADGVQAAIAEVPAPFRLNAKALVALSDAKVGDRVIDLMVGLSYPSKFVVDRASVGSISSGGFGLPTSDPFFSPIVGPAALYNCYAPYAWAANSYWSNCGSMDPYYYARYPGYYSGYWGAYGPDWINMNTAGAPGTALPTNNGEARLVNGRGYTQVRPIETTAGFNGSNGSMSNGGDSGSGGSNAGSGSGVSGSGYSGGGGFSGGGGDRTAVPRGPGGH